jgi:hypothetical protein
MRALIQFVISTEPPRTYTVWSSTDSPDHGDLIGQVCEALTEMSKGLAAQLEVGTDGDTLVDEVRNAFDDPQRPPLAGACFPIAGRHMPGCPHLDWTEPVRIVNEIELFGGALPTGYASGRPSPVFPDGMGPNSITFDSLQVDSSSPTVRYLRELGPGGPSAMTT